MLQEWDSFPIPPVPVLGHSWVWRAVSAVADPQLEGSDRLLPPFSLRRVPQPHCPVWGTVSSLDSACENSSAQTSVVTVYLGNFKRHL